MKYLVINETSSNTRNVTPYDELNYKQNLIDYVTENVSIKGLVNDLLTSIEMGGIEESAIVPTITYVLAMMGTNILIVEAPEDHASVLTSSIIILNGDNELIIAVDNDTLVYSITDITILLTSLFNKANLFTGMETDFMDKLLTSTVDFLDEYGTVLLTDRVELQALYEINNCKVLR